MDRAACIAAAAGALARGRAMAAAMSPRRAAEAAYRAGGPSVDELEARILATRGVLTVVAS